MAPRDLFTSGDPARPAGGVPLAQSFCSSLRAARHGSSPETCLGPPRGASCLRLGTPRNLPQVLHL